MATAARRFLTLGAVLLLLLGIARGSGGIALVLRGPSVVDSSRASPQVASLLGIALLLVAAGAIIAGLALLRDQRWAWRLAIAVPFVFVLDGALNGYLLFGHPGDRGTLVNLGVALLILGALWLGRSERPEVS